MSYYRVSPTMIDDMALTGYGFNYAMALTGYGFNYDMALTGYGFNYAMALI